MGRKAEALVKSLETSEFNEAKVKYSYVCSDHFILGKPADLSDVDHPDYVPSQNLGYQNKSTHNTCNVERHSRLKKRKLNKCL
ncbi:hypothetical protein Zmor_010355 [Zophobas morio]|uniref:Uncharacterized protein n=1 Tax=Zophobas morio TaxID=2755281 RepID=A0AA38MJK1_9CUCU|nr:hypothetical protein Zmor_010355 [Zophobas morio]